jgi:hypothetical protein
MAQGNTGQPLSISFIKPEITQKTGQFSFNVIRIRNHSDSTVRFKPLLVYPDGWVPFSAPFKDTLVQPHDSISLPFRFQLPEQVSAEKKYEIIFRAYSMQNQLLTENHCKVYPEVFHDWNITLPEKRAFFYPRNNLATIELLLENKGNVAERINLNVKPDNKMSLETSGNWLPGDKIHLEAYQDTVIKFNVRYMPTDDRVFDLTKIHVNAFTEDKNLPPKPVFVEKYDDTYAPFHADRNLPHQAETGFRTFKGNQDFLPFIKARGTSTLNNTSYFQYNFNYYALTGNEDLISNTYYSLLYSRKSFKTGIGAFSSELGRNLYTRNGIMFSNIFKINPVLSIEGFLSQSFFSPKTSVAVGYNIESKKVSLKGSASYDLDAVKKVNTGSMLLQSGLITLFKDHDINFRVYGYHEYHDVLNDYTMMGFAWDINYFLKFGNGVAIQITNNYGSPNVPGPQMGLLNFLAQSSILMRSGKKYFSVQYNNSSRKYHTYTAEGLKTPDAKLYDQYANIQLHSRSNPNHTWDFGPSVEYYNSVRPLMTIEGAKSEYTAQKFRFEYKAVILKLLTVNMKTGMSNITIKETSEIKDTRFDFHLLGGLSLKKGYGLSFSYDYGPMVNSGLYQFSGDAKNHSLTISPSLSSYYFNERINFNLFANLIYRFDLQYASFNINPKIEAYVYRDWYVSASGTYHYMRQQYPDILTSDSYTYFELSIKKRWGKSDINKWQKDTRRLRVVMFKDDNGNGVKEDTEQGIPFVKTRLKLTNSDNPNINTQFPVDIILLSNAAGTVNYNRIPKGFYELTVTPLSDVKEYFYVNRSAEKLELTRNATYYIPFQKANKITGKIVMKRQKFIKTGEETLDLANIKITAYNKQGNSYSSFTLQDGSFTIFVPQNNAYYVRMGNVFGPGFKIMQNDINISVGESTDNVIVFNVNEISRQIKFKDALAKTTEVDTLQQKPLKFKVLHGKFYENSSEAAADKDAVPHFEIKEAPVQEENMIPGNFYVVIGIDSTRTDAVKIKKIMDENGLNTSLGYGESTATYYIFTKYFPNKGDAKKELERIKTIGIKEAEIIKYE